MSDESNQDQQSTVEEETKQVNAPVVEDTPVEEKSSNIDASETTDAKLDTKITEETAVPEPENGTDETVAPTKEEPTDSAKPEDSVVKSSEDHTESASDNKEPSDEKSVKAETSTKAEEPEESTKSKGTNGSEKQNGSSTEESLAPLPTGTVVLAKVKGFPAWPGIVSYTCFEGNNNHLLTRTRLLEMTLFLKMFLLSNPNLQDAESQQTAILTPQSMVFDFSLTFLSMQL